jgi:hypothetical protein
VVTSHRIFSNKTSFSFRLAIWLGLTPSVCAKTFLDTGYRAKNKINILQIGCIVLDHKIRTFYHE